MSHTLTYTRSHRAAGKNQQNYNISVGYEKVNAAALQLMNQGHTILEIRIGSNAPTIRVESTQHCRQLGGINLQRAGIRRAAICGCVVEWEALQ